MIAEALAAAVSSTERASLAALLSRIGGPIGEQARELVRARNAASEAERRPMRAAWLVAARAPLPPGFRSIHASWIEASLANLPERARSVLAGASTSAPKSRDEQVDIWLARWACATFPAMPAVDELLAQPRVPVDAARMSAANVLAWLTAVGADQLAYAVGDAAGQFGAQVTAAAQRIATRMTELGPRRDAIARARVDAPAWHHLHVIGARTVAPHIDAVTASVLVHRFDRAMGLVLRDELRAHARLAAATWRAVIAT